MELRIFELPPIGTNAYLLMHTESGKAVLFDAPLQAWDSVQQPLKEHGCELEAVILTHGHWDHILDVPRFNAAGIPVWSHPDTRAYVENPQIMAAFMMPGIEAEPGKVDRALEAGEKIDVAGFSFEVRFVPGHSPDSLLFYCAKEGLAISGDAIFQRSIGRTDLPQGDHEQLLRSIREEVYTLPEDTVLLPGHGPRTTVREEKAQNPFVRA